MLLGIECHVFYNVAMEYSTKKQKSPHYLDNVLKASMTSKCNIRRLLTRLRLRDSISWCDFLAYCSYQCRLKSSCFMFIECTLTPIAAGQINWQVKNFVFRSRWWQNWNCEFFCCFVWVQYGYRFLVMTVVMKATKSNSKITNYCVTTAWRVSLFW